MFMKRGGAGPPLQRQSSTERALARADQRLKSAGGSGGARGLNDSSDDEDDINNYLSSLRKKTQGEAAAAVEKQPRPGRKKLSLADDISDITLTDSSEARSPVPAKSKFLKTKPKAPASSAPSAPTGRALGTAVGASAVYRSAALAEASRALTGKYSGKVTAPAASGPPTKAKGSRRSLKASDSDFSGPSSDFSEGQPRRENVEALYSKSSRAKLGYLTDEESASIGKDGGKFLKKSDSGGKFLKKKEDGPLTPKTRKQLRFAGLEDEAEDGEEGRGGSGRSAKSASSHSSSQRSDRFRRSPAITESDEDMSTAELGEGLLSTSSAPLGPESPKRPSLRSPDTPRSPKKRVTIAEEVISRTPEPLEDVAEAVMDISELSFVPEQFGPASNRSSSPESASAGSEDPIFGRAETIMDAADFLESASDDDASSPRPLGVIRSIEELSPVSSVEEPVPRALRKSRSVSSSSSSTSSTVIHSEARAVASQYSDEDFESISEATRPTTAPPESYAADFESSSSSRAASSSHFERTSTSVSESGSEETTITESYTRQVHRRRHRKAVETDKSVQTHEAGLEFRWDVRQGGSAVLGPALGMASVDLSPIAHFAVSPEALEAVTAYSPSVIALNNMLRQQLELTRNFVATQRRLYDAMARTIAPDFTYTTLEDTKEFIRTNKPKSLTMEEALREVELES